jgi:hypothetical protein
MDSRLRGNDGEQGATSSFFESGADLSRYDTVIPAQTGIQLFKAPSCITLPRDWLVSGAADCRLSDRARHRLTNHCGAHNARSHGQTRNGSSLRGRQGSSGRPPPPTPANPLLDARPCHRISISSPIRRTPPPAPANPLTDARPIPFPMPAPCCVRRLQSVMVEIYANCICTANSF